MIFWGTINSFQSRLNSAAFLDKPWADTIEERSFCSQKKLNIQRHFQCSFNLRKLDLLEAPGTRNPRIAQEELEISGFSQMLRRTGHGCGAPPAPELPGGLRSIKFIFQLFFSPVEFPSACQEFHLCISWVGLVSLSAFELVWELLCHSASKELQVTGKKKKLISSFLSFCALL